MSKVAAPLVAPSANPSGRLSPVSAWNVAKMFGEKLDYVLDGGTCDIGLESTVVEVNGEEVSILRYGAVTINDLLQIVSEVKVPEREEAIKSPGMLLRHYAPSCQIRRGIDNPREGEALLAFGDISTLEHGFKIVKNLSERSNLEEAAANFFKMIHELEELDVSGIAVMDIPRDGIGRAINDRLERAVNAISHCQE